MLYNTQSANACQVFFSFSAAYHKKHGMRQKKIRYCSESSCAVSVLCSSAGCISAFSSAAIASSEASSSISVVSACACAFLFFLEAIRILPVSYTHLLVLYLSILFCEISVKASLLLLPYLLWLLFAGYLNFGVYLLNRPL